MLIVSIKIREKPANSLMFDFLSTDNHGNPLKIFLSNATIFFQTENNIRYYTVPSQPGVNSS